MGWGSSIAVASGVGLKHGSDPRLAAIALIRPLAWELPYAAGEALKGKKKKKKKKKVE